jgi:hypothetical protein
MAVPLPVSGGHAGINIKLKPFVNIIPCEKIQIHLKLKMQLKARTLKAGLKSILS